MGMDNPNRLEHVDLAALISASGPSGAGAVKTAYSAAANNDPVTPPDSSTSRLFGQKGSRSTRLFGAWTTGVGSHVTAYKIRVRGYGPRLATTGPSAVLTKLGSDTTQAWVVEHTISTGGASESGAFSLFTDLCQGFGALDVQAIAVDGGGGIVAGDAIVIDGAF